MIKNFKGVKPKDAHYKQIAHIIANLYKIKTINRKIIYTNDELKKLVLDHHIGKQVIKELKELKVTRITLTEYDLLYFNSVLGDQFEPY